MRDDDIGGPIRWRLHLPASPESVYEMLDSDRGRASFWATSASEANGRIRFEFPNGVTTESRIVERDPPSRFVIEYFGGVARFELTADGAGGTDLLLAHEGVDEADWIETHAGWLNVLLPLKAQVAFGVDLRNHDPLRSWDAGYVDP